MRSKNVARNIITSLVFQGVSIVCGFIVPKMIIDSFGSATNGLVNSITQFLSYITLLESGFGPVVMAVLYKPIAKNDRATIGRILRASEKFFRVISLIFIGYIIVLCFVYPIVIDNQFGTLYTMSLLVIMAIGTFTQYFFGMTYLLYLNASQKSYIPYLVQTATIILNTVVIVALIKFGASIQVVELAAALIFVIRPLSYGIYAKKKIGINLRTADKGYIIKQKWDGLAQHIAAVIHGNTDIMVLTVFSSLKEVSVYSVYMMIVKGLKSIIQAFSSGVEASFGDMIAKGEHEVLAKRFSAYETLHYTVSTILFVCAMVLIAPFVSVYMSGVTDADYVRPLFGVLITAAEFVWAIRLPYSSTVLAAGHFKQTRKGAWVEAIVNMALSIILVFKFGIVGVAIGTLVAMVIRTIEFMYHCSKYILKRSIMESFSWLIIIVAESVIGVAIGFRFVGETASSYGEWIASAIVVFGLVAIEVVVINAIFHDRDIKQIGKILKKVVRGRK